MPSPNLVLLYVNDPAVSAAFYSRLLGTDPVAVVPTYAAFRFESGLHLGLWSTSAKNFLSGGQGHRSELAFMVPDEALVRRMHDEWKSAGVPIEQSLQKAVFGLTFVATDPDGHRIRVCVPD